MDDYVRDQIFYYVPSGIIQHGDFAGEEYEGFWWRETADGEGYIMLWADGQTHHTYHRPDELYT